MSEIDITQIESVVAEVLDELGVGTAGPGASGTHCALSDSSSKNKSPRSGAGAIAAAVPLHLAEFPPALRAQSRAAAGSGVFDSADAAVAAAGRAFDALGEMTLEDRGRIIEAIRTCALEHKMDLARETARETGMGRVDHKARKFDIVARKTPGVEILRPECFTGDRGMTVDERAPFGVVAAVTPRTHPVPTLVNNAISLIAGGNAAVFNAHPASKGVFAAAVELLNGAIGEAGGPANLIACTRAPTIESGKALFRHRGVRLILVTGGPGVVREAMRAPKRAICAGPGNPPVVVDETADLEKAAAAIVEGAGFDNNLLCVGEKQIFAVEAIAGGLIEALEGRGCVVLDTGQVERMTRAAFGGGEESNRELTGQDARVLAEAIGLKTSGDPPLLIGETGFDHPFVQREQMMPFIPLVRCRDASEAIARAIESEHGYGHTAVIHSLNIANMHAMARRVNTTIFVKNGSSAAGLGAGGEGFTSFSIAGWTGEGLTTARTFTRSRRCTLVDYFRIV